MSREEEVEETGWAAYRLMADVEAIRNDALTKEVVDEHAGNCWADANKSVMMYMIRGSGKLNVVLSHPDEFDTSTWTRVQYLTELRKCYADVDPRALRLINLSNGPITNWPVHQVAKLPAWTSQSGRFVLIGDAAHAMAFYLSMGVSLAIEDARALATALELRSSSQDTTMLATAMHLFEKVRKPRAERIRDASLHAGAMLHLLPGSERDLRDESARRDGAVLESRRGDALLDWTSYGITDKVIRGDCYGYDVDAEMRRQAQEDGILLP
ncbi:hypothetical protein E8E12_010772 [Didymella heteroderae]|uniref:FAD-binding domain-containing protein n=1 Tax=Didymella heteroderae TaxID=1769908 RepID=A0A9P4WZ39_9PLEO|nr:hypothetical protein E8E12_010772 [Didymella heteroderae]